MRTVANRTLLLGGTWAVLIGILIVYLGSCGPTSGTTPSAQGTGSGALGHSTGSFAIEGNATEPMSPGADAPLDLKLTNPNDGPMSVTNLRVSVQNVTAPNADQAHPCAVGDFMMGQVSGHAKITVAARATRALSSLGLSPDTWPHLGMPTSPANQDGCKGASLTLTYTASATLGNR